MNILSMNLSDLQQKHLEKQEKLGFLDSKIESLEARIQSDLLQQGQTIYRKQSALSEMRSKRIVERAHLQDMASQIRILKRQFYENRIINRLLALNHSLLYEIVAAIPEPDGHDVERSYLVQQRFQAYRNLESCIREMDSIRYQQYRLMSNGKEQDSQEWELKLAHAMGKANRYFARQCGKIKSIRHRLVSLSLKDKEHLFYQSAVNILGYDRVNEIGQEERLLKAA